MGIFTLNITYTLWITHAQSLECLICSVLKNWSFELVFVCWCPPQNIDGETVKYFCKWHGHVDDDVFARITFRERWWEIPTRARNSHAGCDVASMTPIRFTAAHSGVIRKYRMYGVLGHLGFCLWLRHPRWPQWCVAACYVRSVSMRVWCETTTGAVVVLLMLCYGRAPLFTGFPLGKSQLTIERCHSFD